MRKRIGVQRVKVGELSMFISKREERERAIYGEIVSAIMEEKKCTWEEAKKIHKFKTAERMISREFSKI